MNTKNGNLIARMFQEGRWDAWMDALEANWMTKIAATQDEFRDERMRMQKIQAELEAEGEQPIKSV